MSISFNTEVMEDRERDLLSSENLEQRIGAFKEDEELMKETTKFVADVIETAATEVNKRKLESGGETSEDGRLKGGKPGVRWNNRARGFCNRILNALCPCFINNELFAWAPCRYRFTRH